MQWPFAVLCCTFLHSPSLLVPSGSAADKAGLLSSRLMSSMTMASRESCCEDVEKRWRSRGRGRQRHAHAKAGERGAGELQRSVMALHDRRDDREPEAAAAGGPIARWIQAQQALAEPRQDVIGGAGARILD